MRELTEAQKMMVKDGMPAKLMLTAEERKQAWVDNPPRKSEWNTMEGESILQQAKRELNETAKANKVKPATGKLDAKKAAAKVKEISEVAKKKVAVKKTAAKAAAPKAKVAKSKEPVDRTATTNIVRLCAQFECREGSNREAGLKKLAATFGKPVHRDALIKAIYGSNGGTVAALGGVVRGFQAMIAKNKLPYAIDYKDGSYAIVKK